jgi:hypothetical protein
VQPLLTIRPRARKLGAVVEILFAQPMTNLKDPDRHPDRHNNSTATRQETKKHTIHPSPAMYDRTRPRRDAYHRRWLNQCSIRPHVATSKHRYVCTQITLGNQRPTREKGSYFFGRVAKSSKNQAESPQRSSTRDIPGHFCTRM